MSAPRLSRMLTLEARVRTGDGMGGFREVWQPLGTLWAEIILRTGGEAQATGAPVSRVRYQIVVRGAPFGAPQRPRPRQRLREGARAFVITAVSERDPEGRYLTCFAEEEVVA